MFSHSVVSNSLRYQGLQHARLPCLSPSSGVCSKSCLLSQLCHLVFCRPFLLLPSIFPRIRVFSNKSALCIRWPKYWSFSFSISPSNLMSLISHKTFSLPLSISSTTECWNTQTHTYSHLEFLYRKGNLLKSMDVFWEFTKISHLDLCWCVLNIPSTFISHCLTSN